MISEQDKEDILNGAYGITRAGIKAKYIGLCTSNSFPYYFVFLNEDGKICKSSSMTNDLKEFSEMSSDRDIVGLWENKSKPFNLEKALQGEPVKLRDGSKAFIKYNLLNYEENGIECVTRYPLIGIYYSIENTNTKLNSSEWTIAGKVLDSKTETHLDIIGMWKE